MQTPILHRPSLVPGERPAAPDPIAQTSPGASLAASAGAGFDGVSFNGYYPPDPSLAVGDSQIVQATNVMLAVYDKAGALLKGPVSLSSLFAGLNNLCATVNGGDPVVMWDRIAHRWFISQIAYNNSLSSNFVCIAVSQTTNALGAFNLYSFSFTRLPDYPKFGVWSSSNVDGGSDYYMTANLFSTTLYFGPVVCAFNGSDMQSGRSPIRYACSQGGTGDFSWLPSDHDGGLPPAKGEPNYMLELGAISISNTGSTLVLQPVVANWGASSGSLTFSSSSTLSVPSFTLACGGGTCIPQAGTTNTVDSLGDRLMYRLAYRNFSTYESLLVNHSVDTGTGSAGVRWYEIRSGQNTTLAASRSVYQRGTFAPDSATSRWMGSIAQDKFANIGVGYSLSSATQFPSIYYSGRAHDSSDALGTLGAESPLMTGSGSETGGSRWGDYTSLVVDPADDCTFWYTNEYFLSGSGSVAWNTRIASFKFSECGAPSKTASTTTLNSSLNPSTEGQAVTFTAQVTAGATGSINFFDASTPLATNVPLDGSSAASMTTSSLTAGSHSITAVYSGDQTFNGSTSSSLAQTVNPPVVAGSFSLTANPSTLSVARSSSGSVTVTVSPSGSFGSPVTLSASGVPPASTVTFSQNPVAGGSGSSVATVVIGKNTPKRAYTLTITGTGGGVTQSVSVVVNVR